VKEKHPDWCPFNAEEELKMADCFLKEMHQIHNYAQNCNCSENFGANIHTNSLSIQHSIPPASPLLLSQQQQENQQLRMIRWPETKIIRENNALRNSSGLKLLELTRDRESDASSALWISEHPQEQSMDLNNFLQNVQKMTQVVSEMQVAVEALLKKNSNFNEYKAHKSTKTISTGRHRSKSGKGT